MKKILQINTSRISLRRKISLKKKSLLKRLGDVKDSCQIEYHGQSFEVNLKQLKTLYKLGEGNFGQVNLVQLIDNPNVIFAIKVS